LRKIVGEIQEIQGTYGEIWKRYRKIQDAGRLAERAGRYRYMKMQDGG
jgi:hypothetical protein